MNEYLAAAEAVLFASGDPMDLNKIAKAIVLNVRDTEKLLDYLGTRLDAKESGICLIRMDDKYQLATKAEYAKQVRNVLEISRNTPLSSASLEVLALICYNQPVTKAFVEQVRGVDCAGVIAGLVQKGLIEEKGRLELPGKPLVYGTTPHFLKCFCLNSLKDLPELPHRAATGGEDGYGDGQPDVEEQKE